MNVSVSSRNFCTLVVRSNVRFQTVIVSLLFPGLANFTPLQANPRGGSVVHGDVSIGAGTGGNLQIRQNSASAIINWDSFSIQAGELTQFRQPNSNSAILNRVTGGDPSAIHGALKGNGNVFVINPNGILVGAGGTIDVHGLVLSTLDVSNGEFLAGGDMVFEGVGEGVTNMGRINAVGGDVFLIGRTVTNSGAITSSGGTVGLAAGEEVLLAADNGAGGERLFVRTKGAGVSGTGILNDGTIEGAAVELKAHGNMYALAINNKGSIRATGTSTSGGKVFLRGAGGGVSSSGSIRASGPGVGKGGRVAIEAAYARVDGMIAAQGGKVRITGTDRVELGGTVDVSSSTGKGGEVVVEGKDLELGSSVIVDASGDTGGGSIQVGGGLQGHDASILNSNSLSVSAGALLISDAITSGRGGEIVLWSDGETQFGGRISAIGASGGDGGFAEVSGRRNLNIDGGEFNLGEGGFLLLDPSDFTITDTVRTAIRPTLNGGTDVVIFTNGTDVAAGNGDIILNSDFSGVNAINGSGSLSLLAYGDLFLRRDLINNGTGNLNLVSGWNGTTPSSFGPGASGTNSTGSPVIMMDSQIFADTSSYGNRNGSVYIGLEVDKVTPTNVSTITVASRAGETNLAGYNLVMVGDNTAAGTGDNRSAQIGYRASDVDATLGRAAATGRIKINVLNDVTLTAGVRTAAGSPSATPGQYNFVQIGHGGRDAGDNGFNHNGNILIQAGLGSGAGITGNIVGVAGANLADFVHIGHGGHGGATASGSFSGDITVSAGSNGRIEMDGGSGRRAFAQIGHGGYDVDAGTIVSGSVGYHSGSITVRAGTDVIVKGGVGATSFVTDNAAYGMIGHGGLGSQSRSTVQGFTGDISVTAGTGGSTGAIRFLGGDYDNNFVQLGHGGASSQSGTGANGHSGNITVDAIGDISFVAGTGTLVRGDADGIMYAQLGHGGYDAAVNLNVLLPAGSSQGHHGNISVVSTQGNVNFFGGDTSLGSVGEGKGRVHYSQLGHGGYSAEGNHYGNISVRAGVSAGGALLSGSSQIRFTAGSTDDNSLETYNYAQLGHGGAFARGDFGLGDHDGDGVSDGNISALSGGDILLKGGRFFDVSSVAGRDENRRAYVQVGHGGFDADDANPGDNAASVLMPDGNLYLFDGYAVGGPTAAERRGSKGDISLESLEGSIKVLSGETHDSFAIVGHGGGTSQGSTDGDQAGNISVTADANGSNRAGGGGNIYFWADDPATFDPNINISDRRYVQLGHGGHYVSGGHTGEITVNAGANLEFRAGGGESYAQLGHGGRNDHRVNAARITATTVDDRDADNIYNTVGTQNQSPPDDRRDNANDRYFAGTHSGDITVSSWGNISFIGYTNADNNDGGVGYAQLGHGGFRNAADPLSLNGMGHNGDISVSAGGLTFAANRTITGAANPLAAITFESGMQSNSYAQLGHGGYEAFGNHFGDISVTAAADIDFHARGGSDTFIDNRIGTYSYVQIGHGGINAAFGPYLPRSLESTSNTVGNIFSEDPAVNAYYAAATSGSYLPGAIGPDGLPLSGQGSLMPLTTFFQTYVNPSTIRFVDHDNNAATPMIPIIPPNRGQWFHINAPGAPIGMNGEPILGNSGDIEVRSMSGDITLASSTSASLRGREESVMVGHGGLFTSGDHSGDISVVAQNGNIDLLAGQAITNDLGLNAFAQIGHGGSWSGGTLSGDITVSALGAGHRFTAIGGSDNQTYVQVGHGGYDASYLSGSGNQLSGPDGNGVTQSDTRAFVSTTDIRGAHLQYWYNPAFIRRTEYSTAFGDNALATNSGIEFRRTITGNIKVEAGDGVSVSGGSTGGLIGNIAPGSYAQIGHGGRSTESDNTGSISVLAGTGAVLVNAGRSDQNYAQIGHGGYFAYGNYTGDVTVSGGQNSGNVGLDVRAGIRPDGYAQIGHGGNQAKSAARDSSNPTVPLLKGNSGNILVNVIGNVSFVAGTGEYLNSDEDARLYVQLGHGGYEADVHHSVTTDLFDTGIGHKGSISLISSEGRIFFGAGDRFRTDEASGGLGEGRFHYAQLGHGGYEARGEHSGSITVGAADDIVFLGGSSQDNDTDRIDYAQLGHGGWIARGNQGVEGDVISVTAGNDIIFRAGSSQGSPVQLGNGGRDSRGDHTADINVRAGGSIELSGTMGRHQIVGEEKNFDLTRATEFGTQTSDAIYDLEGGNVVPGSLVITIPNGPTLSDDGFGNIIVTGGTLGTFSVGNIVGTISYTTGTATNGRIVFNVDVNPNNQASPAAASLVTVSYQSLENQGSWAQIGNGGYNADQADGGITSRGNTGNISLFAGGDVLVNGGMGAQSYAQIGNGGYINDGRNIGNITLGSATERIGGAVVLTGGQGEFFDAADAYAMIGNGGRTARGTHSGEIAIYAGTGQSPSLAGIGVQVQAGTRNNSFAMIGHGGTSSRSGTGNGAAGMEGNSGSITVDAIGNINVISGVLNKGSGTLAQLTDDGNLYAQIGHGGYDSDVSNDGVTVNGNGIGHNGNITVVSRLGSINVLGGDHLRSFSPSLAPTAGVYDGLTNNGLARADAMAGGRYNYAQIGHGGYEARGNHYGNISVHAGFDADGVSTGGTGSVTVQGGRSYVDQDGGQHYAQIGHGGRTAVGDQGRAGEVLSVIAGGDITVQAGDGVDNSAMVGNGGTNARGDHSGDVRVYADGNVNVLASQLSALPGLGNGNPGGYVFTGTDATNSIDRAANLLDGGDFNIRNNRIAGGSVYLDVFNDLGVKIGTVADFAGNGELRVVSNFTELVGGVQYTANQQIGTVTAAGYTSGGTVTIKFTSDINPGADDGVPNLVLYYQNAQTDRAYAMIGHGGYDADNPDASTALGNTGNISVSARRGDILVKGGLDDDTSATIGHGGRSTMGSNTGMVDIEAGGSLELVAGNFIRAYASIGHGGYDADGNHTGDICIHVGENVLLDSTQGTAQQTYTQIGHGQYASAGNQTGFITVVSGLSGANGGIQLLGGLSGSTEQYSQIGHGGIAASGNHSGNITLIDRAGGSLTLTGGNATSSYALVGHGDAAGSGGIATTTGTRSGNLYVEMPGTVNLVNGVPVSSSAILGHRSTTANQGITAGTVDTSLIVGSINNAEFNFNTFINAAAFGGVTTIAATASNLLMDDEVNYNSAYAVNLLSFNDVTFAAGLQNSGSGAVNVVAGWNGSGGRTTLDYNSCEPVGTGAAFDFNTLVCGDFGTGDQGTVFVGNGTQSAGVAVGSRAGDTSVYGHKVSLTGSNTVADGFAQIGFRPTAASTQPGVGAIAVEAHEGGLVLTGGLAAESYTQIGHGGIGSALNNHYSAITIDFCEPGDVVFNGGGDTAYAQIGHGGIGVGGTKDGSISLSGFSNLDLNGGSGSNAYSQIGHGGASSFGAVGAGAGAIDITGTSGSVISLDGGAGSGTGAQIGHGGSLSSGALTGNIGIANAGGSVTLTGGSGQNAVSRIGLGGNASSGAKTSVIDVLADTVTITGGSGASSNAQVGSGGRSGTGAISGTVSVESAAVDTGLFGGAGSFATARIGHGGESYNGSVTDQMISVVTSGSLRQIGGAGLGAGTQIGHGGANARGAGYSGELNVLAAGGITVTGGSGTLAFSQIGNGGASADASFDGDISVTAGTGIQLTGTPANGAYAQIGNGDDLRGAFISQSGTGNRSGNIHVAAGTDVSLSGALIGHLNRTSAATGVSGSTQIGVSRNNPSDPSGGSIIADAGSEFQGTDEIRFYVPRRANNRIASGARLNGAVWSGAPADPSPVQRIDEYTINITGIITATPNEHGNVFDTGASPANAAGFAFYYDTISLGEAPPANGGGNGGNGGSGSGGPGPGTGGPFPSAPGPDFPSFLPDDRTLDDWLRDEEGLYSGPGEASIYYEGYEQYGPNGESIFSAQNAR